jgi:excisionase family DNA binding protein
MADYILPGEAADLLGVTRDTIRRYVDQGLLEGIKTPGGQRRIDLQSVQQIIRPGHTEGPRSLTSQ